MKLSKEALEAKREYQREWRKRNKERLRKYYEDWRKNNPDKIKEYQTRHWEKKAKQLKQVKEG